MEELFLESLEWELEVYMTDKVILFTRPKNASRVTDVYLLQNAGGTKADIKFGYGIDGLSFVINEGAVWTSNKDGTGITEARSSTKVKELEKELNLVFTGKSKKDIIFFYRNPIDRLVSGLYQEFISTLQDSKFFYYNTKDLNKKNKEMLKQIRFYLNNINGQPTGETMIPNTDMIIEKNLDVITKLLEEWFEYLEIEHHFNMTHCNTYLFIFNEILNLPKVDLNKCFIYNTSHTQVETVLADYIEPNSKIKGIKNFSIVDGKINKNYFSSKRMKNLVYQICNSRISNNNHRLYDLYKEEIVSFYKLESHTRNKTKITSKENLL